MTRRHWTLKPRNIFLRPSHWWLGVVEPDGTTRRRAVTFGHQRPTAEEMDTLSTQHPPGSFVATMERGGVLCGWFARVQKRWLRL